MVQWFSHVSGQTVKATCPKPSLWVTWRMKGAVLLPPRPCRGLTGLVLLVQLLKQGWFFLEGFNLKVGFMAPKMGFRGLGLVFWSCVPSLCFLGLHSTQCKAGAWGALSPC